MGYGLKMNNENNTTPTYMQFALKFWFQFSGSIFTKKKLWLLDSFCLSVWSWLEFLTRSSRDQLFASRMHRSHLFRWQCWLITAKRKTLKQALPFPKLLHSLESNQRTLAKSKTRYGPRARATRTNKKIGPFSQNCCWFIASTQQGRLCHMWNLSCWKNDKALCCQSTRRTNAQISQGKGSRNPRLRCQLHYTNNACPPWRLMLKKATYLLALDMMFRKFSMT